MSQSSFADAEYAGKKKTRREVLLEITEPHYPVAGCGRRPYALDSMLRVHLMQHWFAVSDLAMEEALYEMASLRSFARLSLNEPVPDETTILNFRHLLAAHIAVDADSEDLQWHFAARPSDIAKLPEGRVKARVQKDEHRKASVGAKVEHPFRVIKRQFGRAKVRFHGLARNTAHVGTLLALSSLWMARKQLMAMTAVVRFKTA